ncbi:MULTISPECIES: hypothetical protein [Shewanella]|uniref:hypothetical protein n=1 Tax=Shewanella TaxID=22 RepID=UPI0006D67216|nr:MULTISPECIES: hypothetical protein [Shewanella]KPZ72222.1 hypothetical protein AN944_01000 [Shewanella sp. P1-14-1]MBQ4889415.1 hypothetical protein [Shewanella sp. MMG014]
MAIFSQPHRLSMLFVSISLTLAILPSHVMAESFRTSSMSAVATENGAKHRHSAGSHRYDRYSGSSVRWGVGYNNYWGPSIGVGWSSGWNNRWYNRWGYNGWGGRWGNGWRYPYRYDYYDRYYRDRYMNNQSRNNYVEPVTAVEAPKRTTTSIEYAKGISKLPDNARVIQRDGHTYYEWDGHEYYFDWSTERYFELEKGKQ